LPSSTGYLIASPPHGLISKVIFEAIGDISAIHSVDGMPTTRLLVPYTGYLWDVIVQWLLSSGLLQLEPYTKIRNAIIQSKKKVKYI
jgi:hypothetical protein